MKVRACGFFRSILLIVFTILFLLGCPPFKSRDAAAEGAGERALSPPNPALGIYTPATEESRPAAAASLPENAAASREDTSEPHEEAALSETSTTEETVEVSLPPESVIQQGPRFALSPGSARPGEPVTVAYSDTFRSARVLQAVLMDISGKRIIKAAFFSLPREDGEREIKAAVFAIPSTAASGNAIVRIESADGVIRDLPFFIESRGFPSETIPLNPVNTGLRTTPDPQKTAESEQLWAILSRTGTEIYSGSQFVPPVTSTRRTSDFGHRRVYEYSGGSSDTAIHAGIDFGVPLGTEVRACASGRVVLAKPRIVTGNSVIIEHLPGVYSIYYHLDSISVIEGAIVEAGALLGLSGSTGLSTGPHLHWEIRVSTENADPDVFLSRPILDKNDIISKMRS